ncbi:MAG: ABC transporter ATP-binding protein [Parvularculales bacterium]
MMAEPVLDIKNLSVSFRDGAQETPAVRGVSFHINPGETVALVGESGSGKSVTALSILKLLPYPAAHHPSGEIVHHGHNLMTMDSRDLRAIRGNRISMIFQEPMTSLNPLHTIGRQVGEALTIHQGLRRPKVREGSIDLLERVGIPDAASRFSSYPHQLSGGQRQRVMIAMALANRPDLLIADEPTTALDVTVQARILTLLQNLRREMGMAMLLITHDLGVVRKMADRVCVMTGGKIVEQGPITRIFENPRHEYTRHLLNSEPEGRAPDTPADAPVVMNAQNIKVWFPVKRGLMRRTVDHIKAVNDVSLCVRAGHTVGVVGESGSGKTTLAQALLRLVPSQGGIDLQQQQISGLGEKSIRPKRRDMQIVFQDPYGSLSPRMSVERIIEEGLQIHEPRLNARERLERVHNVLEEVGLDPGLDNRYPHEFSGGQRQRIAIARALVLNPRFMVLDEPTSALDMSVQTQIIRLLLALQKRYNLAYLFISHDLKVVRALADSVIVMRDGQIVEQGAADDIFDRPQIEYTRALMAAAFALETEAQV